MKTDKILFTCCMIILLCFLAFVVVSEIETNSILKENAELKVKLEKCEKAEQEVWITLPDAGGILDTIQIGGRDSIVDNISRAREWTGKLKSK